MSNNNNLELNSDFKACLDEMENGDDCLFITGKAGTGKSTLLKYFCQQSKHKIVVVAPTGIAALNISGQTIHSFFGFPPRPLHKSEIKLRKNHKLYKSFDILIIDEISMVRADMIDNIDLFLRINGKDRYKPFGGAKLIMFGDLFQLPPVVSTPEETYIIQQNYESPYFFSAHVFENYPIQMFELREVYRQTDRQFIRILDAVRNGSIDYDELETLNERCLPDFPTDNDFYIILSARNASVNEINKKRLDALQTAEFSYLPQISGEINAEPVDSPLKLKVGAQVMFLKNDPIRRFVNGSIGKIVYLNSDEIEVELLNSENVLSRIQVERSEWEAIKYELGEDGIKANKIGTYKQFPLKTAWAMTIHKSQGKTFDRIIIDLKGGAFESGQTYVALSRCRTLEGIVLKNPVQPRDIMVDPRILDFYQMHF
jgi:ATP-dependent DNA helicase PIF1